MFTLSEPSIAAVFVAIFAALTVLCGRRDFTPWMLCVAAVGVVSFQENPWFVAWNGLGVLGLGWGVWRTPARRPWTLLITGAALIPCFWLPAGVEWWGIGTVGIVAMMHNLRAPLPNLPPKRVAVPIS